MLLLSCFLGFLRSESRRGKTDLLLQLGILFQGASNVLEGEIACSFASSSKGSCDEIRGRVAAFDIRTHRRGTRREGADPNETRVLDLRCRLVTEGLDSHANSEIRRARGTHKTHVVRLTAVLDDRKRLFLPFVERTDRLHLTSSDAHEGGRDGVVRSEGERDLAAHDDGFDWKSVVEDVELHRVSTLPSPCKLSFRTWSSNSGGEEGSGRR